MFGSIAVVAGLWALALYAGYGQALSIGPWRISSRNPVRPLLAGAAAAAVYAFVSGASGLRRDAARVRAVVQTGARVEAHAYEWIESRVDARLVALIIAVVSSGAALTFRESTAGGSDAFSYVTQADLWKAGTPGLRVELPIAAAAPWPDAIATFTPFGYRATPDRRGVVPVTAPGLSLVMAAVKTVAGHCAMFWVVPVSGGLLVWATFLIARRAVSDAVGLAAAWLVATSPTFLSMSKWVMSDVPAAAFWALATALLLRRSPAAAWGAGLSVSAATLIRANLLPPAVVLGAWIVWRELKAAPGDRGPRMVDARRGVQLIAFAAGALPGCVAIAGVNRWLFGSSLRSGYGDLSSVFEWGNITINIRNYATWLAETQTPLALVGVAALAIAWRRLWPTPLARSGARLLALELVSVFAVYAAYSPFQDWWYLRFLLPAWPAIFIGIAALIIGLARSRAAWPRGVAALVIIGLGFQGIVTARRLGVYPPGEGERRYATIAELVARVTDPPSVIITTAHVGPMRYYGGRLTVRYDNLDPAWLDRALEWLEQQGRHPYILLEEQEVPEFRERFGAGSRAGRLEMTPMLSYEAHQIPGRVYLFDPRKPAATTWQPEPIEHPQPRCPVPAATPPDYRTK